MGYGKVTEVLDEGDESSAPPNVLLAAQQHSQLVEKAGGKGSWTRQANWYVQDWQYESRPKGKGKDNKGKGKKGKSKGIGGKQPWGSWGDDKPKGTEAGSGMFWKKLPCGVIRSFNLFFRSTITSSKQLLGVSSPAKNRLGLIF
jgi:hypothetical protein